MIPLLNPLDRNLEFDCVRLDDADDSVVNSEGVAVSSVGLGDHEVEGVCILVEGLCREMEEDKTAVDAEGGGAEGDVVIGHVEWSLNVTGAVSVSGRTERTFVSAEADTTETIS